MRATQFANRLLLIISPKTCFNFSYVKIFCLPLILFLEMVSVFPKQCFYGYWILCFLRYFLKCTVEVKKRWENANFFFTALSFLPEVGYAVFAFVAGWSSQSLYKCFFSCFLNLWAPLILGLNIVLIERVCSVRVKAYKLIWTSYDVTLFKERAVGSWRTLFTLNFLEAGYIVLSGAWVICAGRLPSTPDDPLYTDHSIWEKCVKDPKVLTQAELVEQAEKAAEKERALVELKNEGDREESWNDDCGELALCIVFGFMLFIGHMVYMKWKK